jgi:fructoselysine transporter
LIRGVGLRSAVAINIATIVGAGPLITIPLVVATMHGSITVWPWIAGAAIALCDGLVYAELASRFPRSGGTYAYLREAFGAHGPGRLAAFIFVWQLLFVAPLTMATGYIGFAQYAAYLVPAAADPNIARAIAIALGIITLLVLYRTIPDIARTALALGAIAVLTLVAIAACGFLHPTQALGSLLVPAFSLNGISVAALGAALVITLYDYAGYNDVCQIGDEVIAPVRTIPRAVVLSILIVAVAYVALNLGIFSALSLNDVAHSTSVASLAVERTAGPIAAKAVTVAILITAFASTFGLLLGASRVPYAAALDGDFLAPFARLHPTKRFPHVSLVVLGLLALPATLFPLNDVINALTAGIVLVQGVGGTVAVMVLRRRAEPAPFRLPLYPLPVLIALGSWLFLFWSSGTVPMLLGLLTLASGAAIFLVRARFARAWPFALAGALALLIASAPHAAGAATFTHARIVQRDGTPQLQVDGKPFFFFGGAFFYERIPPEHWRDSMLAMRAAGANTLDLYVPWNWHETADGSFDFDGHTNPRRNLRRVLQLARELGFHLIVRPGPVIRNEWRNGGYPDWLLRRPEYGMPLHDILEGRYPATATLQNANSDDAAAEWMRNPTHMRYAARWLHRALREFVPYADLVIAVALDDDQGAYIDNQTWPAPHLQTYLRWLDRQVRSVTGPVVPTFINTYDMKVPASSPVWAMGNWYQSDAYAIGDHDRVELDFATATLTAQERTPLATSEFQAGWLASPEDPQPRAADPSNTTLALAELLSWGVHGVVDFPLQDTLAPFGWEAPFSNAFYSWDAAIARDPQTGRSPPRWLPTRRFGQTVLAFGPQLATTHRVARIAIADEVSASNPRALSNDDVATIAAQLKDALRTCNARGLTCDVVDLRFSSNARLRAYATLVVPPFVRPPEAAIRRQLMELRRARVAIVARVPNTRGPGIVVLAGVAASFGVAVNWSSRPRAFRGPVWDGTAMRTIRPFTLPPRDARVFLVAGTAAHAGLRDARANPPPAHPPRWQRVNLNATQAVQASLPQVPAGTARAFRSAAFGSGGATVTLANDRVVAIFAPDGGARLVVFAARRDLPFNAVNATGALRDDVLLQPPPSSTDRIAKYTHSYPAGTFNRPYRTDIIAASGTEAVVRFRYVAPDLAGGTHFEKIVRLAADATRLVVDERVTFDRSEPEQRALTLSALAVPPSARVETGPTFLAWDAHHAISVAWGTGTLDRATWTPYGSNGTLTLVAAGSSLRTTYALARAPNLGAAQTFAERERAWLAAHPGGTGAP